MDLACTCGNLTTEGFMPIENAMKDICVVENCNVMTHVNLVLGFRRIFPPISMPAFPLNQAGHNCSLLSHYEQ